MKKLLFGDDEVNFSNIMLLVGLFMLITHFINYYIFEFLKVDVARNVWYWGGFIVIMAMIGRYMETIDEIRQDVKDIKKKLSND